MYLSFQICSPGSLSGGESSNVMDWQEGSYAQKYTF